MPRRLVLFVAASLLLGGCATETVRSTASPDTTMPEESVTQSTAASITAIPAPALSSGEVGLYRAAPETLTPLPGAPLTTGDWLSGTMSPNREWLVLNVWMDTEPDTDVLRVIEVATGRVVTEVIGPLRHDLRVGDDGAVFSLIEPMLRLRRLDPGGDGFETVFDAFPEEFVSWGSMTLLDAERVGWLGTLGGDLEEQVTGIVVADLARGKADVHPLSDVAMGFVGEEVLGEWAAPEQVEPAVVWDIEQNRALVVHADQPVVTVVDLGAGSITERTWSSGVSWLGNLSAWLIPPANAKGPSYGSRRSAVLSPSAHVLYVAFERAEVVWEEEEEWSIRSSPQGVEAINTETWDVIARWDIPASQLSLSPDGSYLVATGLTTTEKLSTIDAETEGTFIIRTDTLDLVGHVDSSGDWWHPDIQYSADSTYLYVGRPGGGRIEVVDLETAEVVQTVGGPEQLTVFGEVALIATTIR